MKNKEKKLNKFKKSIKKLLKLKKEKKSKNEILQEKKSENEILKKENKFENEKQKKTNQKPKVSFPAFGSYNVAIAHMIEKGLDAEYVYAPETTKRTLEIGSKYSPDFVCTPFKIHLGGFIEAIEAGADTLVQVGGVCRLGYYGELHEQILKDMGYNINFINMANVDYSNPLTFYDEFKKLNPHLDLKKAVQAALTAIEMVKVIDRIEDYIRQNIGFEVKDGEFEQVHKDFLDSLEAVDTIKDLKFVQKLYMKKLKNIKINKPEKPIMVGLIGEYFTIMDDFSNHNMEKELAKKGIVIKRWMNLTNSILSPTKKETKSRIKNYVKYDMGATAMYTIRKAMDYAKDGCSGLIHVKSAGCTPEIDAMPVLQRISEDYKIPIIYFSFDTQTSDVGINTRIEAFYDMIMMRKESQK